MARPGLARPVLFKACGLPCVEGSKIDGNREAGDRLEYGSGSVLKGLLFLGSSPNSAFGFVTKSARMAHYFTKSCPEDILPPPPEPPFTNNPFDRSVRRCTVWSFFQTEILNNSWFILALLHIDQIHAHAQFCRQQSTYSPNSGFFLACGISCSFKNGYILRAHVPCKAIQSRSW